MTAEQIGLLVAARKYAKDGTGRAVRHCAGLSMAEIAQSVKVAESTISRWETALRRPHGPGAIAWAELLASLERTA